jgi:HSP20 family molecular chaperone IbpA
VDWDFGPYREKTRGGRIQTVPLHKQLPIEEIVVTKLPARHQRRSLFPELSEWFSGFPTWADFRLMFDTHPMRLEEDIEDGRYVLRAELPGIDPAKDVAITVRDGQLTIKAERREKKESDGRSEFSYGSFVRSVSLPSGANEDDIKATYDKGILTVSVAVPQEAAPSERHITVQLES